MSKVEVMLFPSVLGFFIRPFYKMMLGKPITLKDMESVVRTFHPYQLQKLLEDFSFREINIIN